MGNAHIGVRIHSFIHSRLALRKQGLRSNISCDIILASARYTYAHAPATETKLRAYYLLLVVRECDKFKGSIGMQREMGLGGKFFWDLFVTMCNHFDDLSAVGVAN